jgi:hypothetical protein
VLRLLGAGGDACSLGRHCEVIGVKRDADAYRRSHRRFSDTAGTGSNGTSRPAWRDEPSRGGEGPPPPDASLMDVFVDAMERLDRINPPDE